MRAFCLGCTDRHTFTHLIRTSIDMTQLTTPTFDKGLANTIAAESQMSFIDGAKGILEYVGIEIDSLARNSTFEEVVYLLWNRRLPTRNELDAFVKSIQSEYDLPPAMWDMIRQIQIGRAHV